MYHKLFLMQKKLFVSEHLKCVCRFGNFVFTVVRDMVIPNCVWKAGQVASAVRTTAISCLWALLEGSALRKEKVSTFYLVAIFSVN